MIFLKKYIDLSFVLHIKNIFEGIIPLVLIIFIYHIIHPEQLIYKMGIALLFITTYIFFNHLLKTEGYMFVKSNYPSVIKKIKNKLKK